MKYRRYQREKREGGLDQRQERILAKVVDLYTESAQPVSSAAVSQVSGLGLSSATLRNQMAELEQEGYLSQPHPSSGRVPTARGFRYYLNHLLRERPLSRQEQENVRSHYNRSAIIGPEILHETSRVLSLLSHYAGVVFLPSVERAVIRTLTFLSLRQDRILAVLVTASGRVEQRAIPNQLGLDSAELQRIGNRLQPLAEGKTLVELRAELERQQEAAQAACDRLLLQALSLSERLVAEDPASGWFIEGQSKILEQPEFSDVNSVKRLLQALEEKAIMIRLVDEAIEAEGPRVIIGDESSLPGLQHLALVTDRYLSEDTDQGFLGVLGPLRMDYVRVIPLVKYTAGLMTEFLRS
jgi:heat-inducible transcriptional repressor